MDLAVEGRILKKILNIYGFSAFWFITQLSAGE